MFRPTLCAFIFLLCGLNIAPVRADEFYRPKNATELDAKHTVEKAVRVKNSKIAWANYPRIRADFPQVAHYSDSEINDWLILNFAYIGQDQSKLNHIRNTEIPTDESDLKNAYRPEGWRRSAVLEAHGPDGEVIGTADVKGFGHGKQSGNAVPEQVSQFNKAANDPAALDKLRLKDHSNGLMSFGEANAETSRQQAAQQLFELNGVPLETVDTYAVIELPFDILMNGEQKDPAALYIRQSHIGRKNGAAVPPQIYIDEPGGRQQTRFGTSVDFGGVTIKDKRLEKTFTEQERIYGVFDENPWVDRAIKAAARFRAGKLNAVKEYVSDLLLPLKPYMHSPEGRAKIKARRAYQKDMRIKAAELKEFSPAKQAELLKRYQLEHPFYQKAWDQALGGRSLEEFVIRSLDRSDIAPSLLVKALRSPTANYAVYASTKLERRYESEMVPVFFEALSAKSTMIRSNAAKAIASWKDAPIGLLEKILADEEASVRGQISSMIASRSDIKLSTLTRLEHEPQSDYLSRAVKTELARRSGLHADDCLPLDVVIPK